MVWVLNIHPYPSQEQKLQYQEEKKRLEKAYLTEREPIMQGVLKV